MTEESILPENKILCLCGCGELLNRVDKWGNKPKFIQGHNIRGSNNPSWNGGLHYHKEGYIKEHNPQHIRSDRDGYVMQHILVFERTHNCCVLNWGVVHHIDGNKRNNESSNLEGMTKALHTYIHWKGKKRLPHSDEWRRKVSMALKGRISPMKGRKRLEKTR